MALAIFVFLNIPSLGATYTAPTLPSFWRFLNHFWIGAETVNAERSVLYFGGLGVGTDLLRLLSEPIDSERRVTSHDTAAHRALARVAIACLVAGVGLLTVADATWAHAIGVSCLIGFVVLAFCAIAVPTLDEPAASR